MQVNESNYATQQRVFSGTGKIGSVKLPDFGDVHVYTKKAASGRNFSKAIVEQAQKDQAAGKFQNESAGFNSLAKSYVSEVSPDRRKIITSGLREIAKNSAIPKAWDYFTLLHEGRIEYTEDSKTVSYAKFKDENGETVAVYSNGGWTMMNTKAETNRQIEMCRIYNDAWRTAAKGQDAQLV